MSNLEETVTRIDSIINYYKSVGTDTETEKWPWGFLRSLRTQCADRRRMLTTRQCEVLDDVYSKWSQDCFEKKVSDEAMWQARLNEEPEIKQQLKWVINSLNASSLADIFTRRSSAGSWCFRKDVLQSGYWSSIRTKFDASEEITKKDFDRLMDNKFSGSLVKAMQSDRKFDVGQLVTVRSAKLLIDQMNKIAQYCILDNMWPLFQDRLEVISPTRVDVNTKLNTILKTSDVSQQHQNLLGMVIEHDPVPSLSNAAGCQTYRIMPVGDWQQATPMLIVEERWLKKMPKKV